MSKAAAETGLRDLALRGAMGVTVVRPPLVYGAGAKGNFSLLEKAVTRCIPLPFCGNSKPSRVPVGREPDLVHPASAFASFRKIRYLSGRG
jgi:nucleoside-diphosphate-sugar epimerase